MPIFAKPFSFTEMLRRIKFLPRPAYFNNEDFNKELEIIHSGMDDVSTTTGPYTSLTITVGAITESEPTPGTIQRQFSWSHDAGTVYFKGQRFVLSSNSGTYTTTYAKPNTTTVSPKQVRPASYVCLVSEVVQVDYAADPALCGLTADELPASVESCEVEQYQNPQIVVTEDPDALADKVCILATIYPRYDSAGVVKYYKYKNSFNTTNLTYNNYGGYDKTTMKSNHSLVDLLFYRVDIALGNVLNERQLVRRHNLADLENAGSGRSNIGFSNLVNHAQLVKAENLKDLQSPANARFHLGLGNAATHNYGTDATSVMRGDVIPVGSIIMWSGSHLNIPNNWRLCDGTNGTPNLKGRFVVGYDADDANYDAHGKTGGAKERVLTINNIPAHIHAVSIETSENGAHTHTIKAGNGSAGGGSDKGDNDGDSSYINPAGAHTHTVDGNTAQAGLVNPEALDNRPPYYTLCFIMFVGYDVPTAALADPNQAALTYPNFSPPSSLTVDPNIEYLVSYETLDNLDVE
jgi:microcystin-dependent protein